MYIFRMIDMVNSQDGVLIDMNYEIVDNIEKIISVNIRNITNNIVGEIDDASSPLVKLGFAAKFLELLQLERNKEQ